jgi:hypothetical protein
MLTVAHGRSALLFNLVLFAPWHYLLFLLIMLLKPLRDKVHLNNTEMRGPAIKKHTTLPLQV